MNDSDYESVNHKFSKNSNPYYDKCHFNYLNKSTMSLPITTSGYFHKNNSNISNSNSRNDVSINSNNSQVSSSTKLVNKNFKPSTVSRSRSPIVIVYDNEDYNLDKTEENLNNISLNEYKQGQFCECKSPTGHLTQEGPNYTINQNNYMQQSQQVLRSPVNYESISESNTPIKSNANSIDTSNFKRSVHLPQSISATSLEHGGSSENSKNNSKISYV